MTRWLICSLTTGGPQMIPPREYTLVRFPFAAESYDPDKLHPAQQPDTGRTVTSSDPRAGLIWPRHDAWAHLAAMMVWQDIADLDAADRPTHVRHRFVRDPLNLVTGYDSTATSDHRPRPAGTGGTCRTKTWPIFVHPGTPLGYLVYHDAALPMRLESAEFKVSYTMEAA
ncbi:hypothetical protein DQ384_21860 [Sphaerisporangium album]|uniref:Uncharacterized protein n=1 Tax=Sphaerisporangium album TaxID=509200 RepID=A0A367FFD4_9ACTN|nr:hypothetical protein [Sphaerisporangium album]RCG29001.1 hypothetical protein DQ384_21860 [Sphaerisporangium album]